MPYHGFAAALHPVAVLFFGRPFAATIGWTIQNETFDPVACASVGHRQRCRLQKNNGDERDALASAAYESRMV
jgi:hypothetical protein